MTASAGTRHPHSIRRSCGSIPNRRRAAFDLVDLKSCHNSRPACVVRETLPLQSPMGSRSAIRSTNAHTCRQADSLQVALMTQGLRGEVAEPRPFLRHFVASLSVSSLYLSYLGCHRALCVNGSCTILSEKTSCSLSRLHHGQGTP